MIADRRTTDQPSQLGSSELVTILRNVPGLGEYISLRTSPPPCRQTTCTTNLLGTNVASDVIENKELILMSKSAKRIRGFSLVELVLAMFVLLLVSAIAVPNLLATLRSYRAQGDARGIAGQISLARMRAAADFTEARLSVNLTANTYRVDVWNKTNACWETDGTTVACDAPISAAVSAPQDINLSQGNFPGFGGVTAAPPSSILAQAPTCLDNAGSAIANTACVVFNSRGIPVTPGDPRPGVNNTATGNDAVYFTNNAGQTFAVTVSASGKASALSYNAKMNAWH